MGPTQPSMRVRACMIFLVAFAFFPAVGSAAFGDSGRKTATSLPPSRAAQMLHQQIYFERNNGQADSQVLYFTRGFGYSLFLTRDGATVVLPSQAKAKTAPAGKVTPDYFRLKFRGANPKMEVSGIEELPGISNYFGGSDPKQWITRVPHFARVRYANLYPGIDIIFYLRDGQLEYDVVAAPGADPNRVRVEIEGIKPELTGEGGIRLPVFDGSFTLRKPRVYQAGTPESLIPSRYSVHAGDVALRLGNYDHTRALVVDPALIFSTYLMSNCFLQLANSTQSCGDTVTDIAADASGVYVTGSTDGPSFPSNNPTPQPVSSLANTQTFVFKLDPTGAHILYANYLSSSAGLAIAVDSLGSAYVSGGATIQSPSSVPAFPLTSGVFSGTIPANTFLSVIPYAAKLSTDGSQLIYSTLLQQPGSGTTLQKVTPAKIAVDAQGALYITGGASTNQNILPGFLPLPVTQGAFQTTPSNLFAMKLTPNASGLAYSTYLDGVNTNGAGNGISAGGIAVDGSGDAFVAGSAQAGFPTTAGAYQTMNLSSVGSSNAFVTELNPTGTAQIYSTLFGDTGSGNTAAYGLALDSQDEAVIAGTSSIPPVTSNAFCGAPPATPFPNSGFIAKFNATGTALVYGTTLCGNFAEADSVAVDSAGAAYVIGSTMEPATFQPVLLDPIESYFLSSGGQPNVTQVALKLDTAGNLQWSTFLATTSTIGAGLSRIVVDSSQNAYILSNEASDFPATPGSAGLLNPAHLAAQGPNLLLEIAPSLGAPVPLTYPLPPGALGFSGTNIGASSSSLDVPLGNFGDAPLAAPTISVTGDFSETDNCSSGVAAGAKCDVNVVFTPTATGTRNGTLVFSFGGGIASQTVALMGTGTAPTVSLAPTSLSFGMQANGTTSGSQQVTVTNGGTGSLTIASIQTTAQFGQTNTCGAAIAPTGTCTIQVTFTPNASGSQTGTLTITDNAPGSPQTVSLAGNQPANFTLAAGSGSSMSATVTPGQSATYNLSVSGANGFSGAVNFSCSGAPASATCSVTPNPANVSGSGAVAVMVSVSTTAASANVPGGISWKGPGPRGEFELVLIALAGFGASVMLLFGRKRKWAIGMGFAAAAILMLAGCGGSSKTTETGTGSAGTPAGQYMITVTGTSGSITQSMNLTLTVN